MKTIGLLGGMSWESTVTYYRIINETVKEKLGGLHSAKIVMYSVDFAEIEACQANGDWEKSGRILSDAAASLEKAGADFIVICTNTMHKTVPAIQARISVPILHIADATAEELIRNGIKRVGLLGTKYTLTQDWTCLFPNLRKSSWSMRSSTMNCVSASFPKNRKKSISVSSPI